VLPSHVALAHTHPLSFLCCPHPRLFSLQILPRPLHGGECSGTTIVTTPTTITDGHLHSTNGVFHINADCTWVITPPDPAQTVSLTFTFLNIEGGFDFVHVYEKDSSTVLAHASGRAGEGAWKLPVLRATGGMVVTFESDDGTQVRKPLIHTHTDARMTS